jgi:23S rRNA (uracil1939-C5)-methyltransferase
VVGKSKRHYAEASALEILRPSRDRVPARCDHAGEPCPGAPWQELPYELQLEHKHSQVDDALRRIGGLDGFELPAIELWRYRN